MIKYLRIVLISLLFPASLLAQQNGTISGKVLTSDGQPAAGITINAYPSNSSTSTSTDGTYRLKLKPGIYKIVVSSIGSANEELNVSLASGVVKQLQNVTLKVNAVELKDVVVTGQYAPQSLKNSVYNVRTISAAQIRLRNPTKVQDVLSDQLGFRFSNDLTLGTTDVTMLGVSGQRVKILLDGVPLLDRGDTRESLNQIDINQIDHVEIVEGPMSVSYGSDALAGVINLITKRPAANSLNVSGRMQEESAGKKYTGLQGNGNHLENLGVNWGSNNWQAGGSFTRNFFDGAQLGWMPKDQYLGSATVGYRTNNLHVWYRLDAENETLRSDGQPNPNTFIETDAHYITYRWIHQLQGDFTVNSRLSFSGAASYTDYSRRTQTTTLNTLTGDRRLTLGAGEQDKSIFDTKFFRGTAQYRVSDQFSLQPGVEVNLTGSGGARILGTPSINDYAFFLSGEWKPVSFISVRPGARFIKNSVYDAPPVIPSLNTKIALSKTFDLRLSYARGFRAPALRELYFNFFDASHSIRGNQNLKAEYSNSFNGSLSWQSLGTLKWKSSVGGFYNDFNNLITTGYSAADASVMTYINVDKAKTAGGSFDNTFNYQNLEAKIGFAYTGVYSMLDGAAADQIHYTWYPEVSTTLLYHFKHIKGDVSLFYKYNGTLPTYELATVNNATVVNLAKRSAFSLADLTLNKQLPRHVTLSGGVKNLFNVTNVNNTSLNVGSAHSTGGPVPLGYGRSYFLGFNFQFSNN